MPSLGVAHRQPITALYYTCLGEVFLAIALLLVGTTLATSTVVSSTDTPGLGVFIFSAAVLASAIALSYPILHYLLFSYEVTDNSITINSGIIFRQHETINFSRIQSIDNERGPLLMLFGLTIFEVWTSSPDQFIPHESHVAKPDAMIILSKERAGALKDFILSRPTGGGE